MFKSKDSLFSRSVPINCCEIGRMRAIKSVTEEAKLKIENDIIGETRAVG
jgi:hypothetical protein